MFSLGACGGESSPTTPSETLKVYTSAVKKKDAKMLKLLLSKASLEIHREQAKAQNVSIDEIILRETLFPVDQKFLFKRNEKIEGDSATIEVKNSFDAWEMIYFVKEVGIWKIDKKGFSDEIIDQNEAAEKELEEQINKDREKTEDDADSLSDKTNETDSETEPDPKSETTAPSPSPGNTQTEDGDPPKSPDQN